MKYALTGLFIGVSFFGFSQSPEIDRAAVQQPIDRLFKGMATGDSALVQSTFSKDVTIVSMGKDKQNIAFKRAEKLMDFLIAVGTPHAQPWNEEIWNIKIEVDDNFAQVWCDYGFYVGNKFSHCGVDAFHLYKEPDGWKIFHLADTRRKEPCEIPAAIKSKHQ